MKPVKTFVLSLLLILLLTPALALAQGGSCQVSLPNGMVGSFASVQGLPAASASPLYRAGEGALKMPGIARYGNLTLLQGSFPDSNQFWRWHRAIEMNTVARETMVISCGDTRWVLRNAWPVQINGVSRQGGMVQVERLEIAHEQITAQPQ